MTRRLLALAATVTLGLGPACKSESETADETIASGSSAPRGSAGGFSASLKAELARSGADSGSAGSGEGVPAEAGSGATAGSAGAGSGATAGSAGAGSAGPGSAGPGSAGPGSGATAGSGTGSAATASKPASGATTGSAIPPAAAGSGAGSAKPAAAVASSPAPKDPVKVSAELAAIKLSLLPNWDRDVVAAGTLSLEMKIRGKTDTALFTFEYGYEDPTAPPDREAYKKHLEATRTLTVAADRQRGAAWMLEGTDARGRGAFRIIVNYGGTRLICHGSLYKDSPLGDDRDEVIIQAKKICETIQL